jgi:hypothetical protein
MTNASDWPRTHDRHAPIDAAIRLSQPLANSYWVLPGRLLVGEHPFGASPIEAHDRIAALGAAGIDYFLDLTESDEMPNYRLLLPRRATYLRRPITDMEIPKDPAQMHDIQELVRAGLGANRGVYIHCRAGIGRSGTVAGCFLVEEGFGGREALRELNRLWKQSERSKSFPKVPQTEAQADFVRSWEALKAARGSRAVTR